MSLSVAGDTPKVLATPPLSSFYAPKFDEAWLEVFFEALGTSKDGDAEIFAEIPVDVMEEVVKGLTKKDEEGNSVKVNPVQMGMLKVFARSVRDALGGKGVESKGKGSESVVVPQAAVETAKHKRKIADVLDQMDDGHFDPLTDSERLEF